MYSGFKLSAIFQGNEDLYYQIGLNLYSERQKIVISSLSKYISTNSVLDGEKMEEDWFPQVNVDVFISHSHLDQKMSIILSGWLYDTFGITTFIDSLIWGCADDLLKEIDIEYCYDNQMNTYDYGQRNFSTSHVHMMLSTALQKMIFKTECLIFINTPSSIMVSEIKTKTLSPWIYSEIAFSNLVRQVEPLRYKDRKFNTIVKGRSMIGSLNEKDIKISHTIKIDHLIDIDSEILNKWAREYYKLVGLKPHALDVLYDLVHSDIQISYNE